MTYSLSPSISEDRGTEKSIQEEYPHVTRWFNTVLNQKFVKSVLQNVDLTISMAERSSDGKM